MIKKSSWLLDGQDRSLREQEPPQSPGDLRALRTAAHLLGVVTIHNWHKDRPSAVLFVGSRRARADESAGRDEAATIITSVDSPFHNEVGIREAARAQPLGRGKACNNCRHLKIKCDGARPVCGQCVRIPREGECEYTDSPSRTRLLQETLVRLQSQVQELEVQEPFSSSLTLSPEAPQTLFYSYADSDGGSQRDSGSNTPSSAGRSSFSAPATFTTFMDTPELNVVDSEILLHTFLTQCPQFVFFLNIPRFQSSLYSGDPNRQLCSSLLNSVYLWSANLSQMWDLEASFLREALGNISPDISGFTGTYQVLQVIQAEVLLGTYFLRANRLAEAQYHANGAMSLAISHGLHKTLSSRAREFDIPVSDSIDQGEAINGFWATLYLRKCLSITNKERCFGAFEPAEKDIDAPWPLMMSEYELGIIPQANECTFQNIFPPDNGNEFYQFMSPTALKMRALTILQRSVHLASRWSPNFTEQELHKYTNFKRALEHAIGSELGKMDDPTYTQDDYPSLYIARAMLHCAKTKLLHMSCSSSIDSKRACCDSIQATLSALNDGACLSCPIVGTLCVLSAEMLSEDIRETRAARDACGTLVGTEFLAVHETVMNETAQRTVDCVRKMNVNNPLMDSQLGIVEALLYPHIQSSMNS
ncbi:hypothetical protein BDZ89DRAFT_1115580 [Hymenopellis radicata]|nr:hypothetical protein BDZ89DRAFT_1115580 [Hymenopellis radicata]